MTNLDNKRFCIKNWYKNKLNKSQKMFFFVFLLNIVGLGFVIYSFIDSLMHNNIGPAEKRAFRNGFTEVDKFTNQSNLLLLVFAFVYVFYPKNSLLKNEKFLIACMTYILFTFVGYNLILNLTAKDKGYAALLNENRIAAFAASITLHFINPVVFIVCGFLRFVFDPVEKIKSFKAFVIPGMIYPIIYLIYVITIPYVYNSHANGEYYSVYGGPTNVIKNPKLAWPICIGMIFVYFPITFFLIWFGARKINTKYYVPPKSTTPLEN
ncbi:DUF1600 domain-containing protein [Mycoplasma bradburyae]|uniref:DUF1600 domain-containing protein n=1 Tax=Mycoplasma bradburyae TaxID=2963128 RepID=UPI002341C997|nr:DUF1600 domain-containing protein [Mycoplasma bradburyae]MDC4182357.1 DUF1600 domain-containing protein [Mycoplasma bradburyae]